MLLCINLMSHNLNYNIFFKYNVKINMYRSTKHIFTLNYVNYIIIIFVYIIYTLK